MPGFISVEENKNIQLKNKNVLSNVKAKKKNEYDNTLFFNNRKKSLQIFKEKIVFFYIDLHSLFFLLI